MAHPTGGHCLGLIVREGSREGSGVHGVFSFVGYNADTSKTNLGFDISVYEIALPEELESTR